MRDHQGAIDIGYLADTDLGEGVAVIPGASVNSVKLPTANGQLIVGVTLFAVSAGQQVTVRRSGVAKCLTSGALTRGNKAMAATTTGAIVAAAASSGVTIDVAGIIEETNGASDTTGYIFLTPGATFTGA